MEDFKLVVLEQAFSSADRAALIDSNRKADSLIVKAKIEAASADAIYPDKLPAPTTDPIPAKTRASITLPKTLFTRAGDAADSAADYSRAFKDVEKRIEIATDYKVKAQRYTAYLAGKAKLTVAEMVALIAKTDQETIRTERLLAGIESAITDKSEKITMLFDKQKDDLKLAKDAIAEAKEEIEKAAEKPTEPRVELARQKVADMENAFANLQKSADKLTIFQAKPVLDALKLSQPLSPTYAPLYLNAK